jgi:hypothetical protein
MATQKQKDAINLYANLMEEVKVRVESINKSLMGSLAVPAPILREFCFLQLRMICELIALGCLVAHGDIEAATKLKGDYAADKIINELKKLHPDFYPKPVKKENDYKNSCHVTDITIGFLTRDELVTLTRKCGMVLHRGALKELLSSKNTVQYDFSDIVSYLKKYAYY